ncbi:D-alanyl-D-alanine carboxypeptidase [Paraoerskovia marina]|uniref:D-alanyl-D-alanine carboxypeptidase n=1 Tax=Paraoerskovia marina TaxID=545619 RepID=A0A1H1NIS3_9CELL|nr:M15 family metallopeptidase [Paraoerskovia marina]SDR98773.1 D-alanyl-D-alanine carboxypeptidase [Paraoerskovia marina]
MAKHLRESAPRRAAGVAVPAPYVDLRRTRTPGRGRSFFRASVVSACTIALVGVMGNSVGLSRDSVDAMLQVRVSPGTSAPPEQNSVTVTGEDEVTPSPFAVKMAVLQRHDVVALLDDAAVAVEDAPPTSPLAQAVSELGMLMATYEAQLAAEGAPESDLVAPVRGIVDPDLAPEDMPELRAPKPADPSPAETGPPDGETQDEGVVPVVPDEVGDGEAQAVSNAVVPAADEVPEGAGPADDPVVAADPDEDAGGATGGATDEGRSAEEAGDADASDAAPDPLVDPHAEAYQAVAWFDVLEAAYRLKYALDSQLSAGPVSVMTQASDDPSVVGEVSAGVTDMNGDGEITLDDELEAVVVRYAGQTSGYLNGAIPSTALCTLDFAAGEQLRCDAADRLNALAKAFKAHFGYDLPIVDSYRPYADQVAVYASRPHLAAVPGTSNHGWGLAVDLGSPINSASSAEYRWLRANGPQYGWDNPSWARPGGSKLEPWHFEFYAGGVLPTDIKGSARAYAGSGGSSSGSSGGSGASSPSSGKGSVSKDPAKPSSTPKEPKPTPSGDKSPSTSPTPSKTPKPSPSTPTTKPTETVKPTPTETPKPTPTETVKPSPTETPKPTPTETVTPSPTTPDPEPSTSTSTTTEVPEQETPTTTESAATQRAATTEAPEQESSATTE